VKFKKKWNLFLRIKKFFVYNFVFKQYFINYSIYSYRYNYNNNNKFIYLDSWKKINNRLAQLQSLFLLLQFSYKEFRKFEKTNI